tara:strand:- start:7668 stop:8273 length:606 start_codon:yes stop_codon:yes gene_type:complete
MYFSRFFKKKKKYTDPMKFLIVGLGNMGADYDDTRHNVGFEIVEALASESDATWEHKKLGDMTKIKHRGKSLILLKPSTYMNRSGKAIQYWMQKEKIKKENLLVIVDDLNLQFGKIRLRGKGSDGGHNGLKDIQNYLGAQYPRIRVGIGDDFRKGQQVDFVLGKWSKEERDELHSLLKKTTDAAKAFTHIGLSRTMTDYNK